MTDRPYPQLGIPFEKGSDTSAAAAASIAPDLARLEALVYEHIRFAGACGLTDDQLEVATGLSHQSVSARRRTLVLKGRVFDSGGRRLTRRGRKAAVWLARSAPATAIEPRPRQPSAFRIREFVRDVGDGRTIFATDPVLNWLNQLGKEQPT